MNKFYLQNKVVVFDNQIEIQLNEMFLVLV